MRLRETDLMANSSVLLRENSRLCAVSTTERATNAFSAPVCRQLVFLGEGIPSLGH